MVSFCIVAWFQYAGPVDRTIQDIVARYYLMSENMNIMPFLCSRHMLLNSDIDNLWCEDDRFYCIASIQYLLFKN